jgi:hypothetical protein
MRCSPLLLFKNANSALFGGLLGGTLIAAAVPAYAYEVTIVPPRIVVAPTAGVLLAPSAPPAVAPEVIPQAPAPDDSVVWHPGHWVWAGGNWVWAPGSYVTRPRATAMWQPGHWVERPDGSYAWDEGHWD